MIPLASDLIPFPGQMRREGHLKYAGLPDRLSSSSRITILGNTLRSCREVIAVPVDKIAWRCKRVTERANMASVYRIGSDGLSVRKRQVFIDLLRSVSSPSREFAITRIRKNCSRGRL